MKMMNSDKRSFTYHIDQDDRIFFINQEWLDFADENQSANLSEETIIGTSLWNHIVNSETVHIYETLIQKVRNGHSAIKIPYRCDSPNRRRFMEMNIAPLEKQGVAFVNVILREELRPVVQLLNPQFPRNEQMLRMCGWCKKVNFKDNWLETDEAVTTMKIFDDPELPKITHGICPPCKSKLVPA
jgi:hypothetical protein